MLVKSLLIVAFGIFVFVSGCTSADSKVHCNASEVSHYNVECVCNSGEGREVGDIGGKKFYSCFEFDCAEDADCVNGFCFLGFDKSFPNKGRCLGNI